MLANTIYEEVIVMAHPKTTSKRVASKASRALRSKAKI